MPPIVQMQALTQRRDEAKTQGKKNQIAKNAKRFLTQRHHDSKDRDNSIVAQIFLFER